MKPQFNSIELVKPKVYRLTNTTINTAEIGNLLVNECLLNGWPYARVCLHRDENSILMSMLIVVLNKYIYPPHRHNWKDESYTVVAGTAYFHEFNEISRSIVNTHELREGSFYYNLNKGFHTIQPLTDVFLFIEHTTGPFTTQPLEFFE